MKWGKSFTVVIAAFSCHCIRLNTAFSAARATTSCLASLTTFTTTSTSSPNTATSPTSPAAHADVSLEGDLREQIVKKQILPGVYTPDEPSRINLMDYPVAIHYQPYLDYILFPNQVIRSRVHEIANQLAIDFEGRPVHMLCVLKGGAVFFADLLARWMELQHGDVRIEGMENLSQQLAGKDVVIVEDIIDTGLTMERLVNKLQREGQPASIRVVSLLEKRTGRPSRYLADYVGFSIPDLFLVGYGMDFNEAYRDMDLLAVINQAGYEKYK
eukprot:scaffold1729_cov173-Ochromonas_danica.AAC.3